MAYMPHRILCLCVLLAGLPAVSGESAGKEKKLFAAQEWTALSDDHLDTLRGGFEINTGLSVSFGFIRTISINGDVVSETRFTLPDLSHISADQAKIVSAALAGAHIVQNGAGNSVGTNNIQPPVLPAITVVQNSLDHQAIQSLTVVDAAVNSLGILKNMNVQNILKDALLGAVTVH
jgi:hypothetical protein